MERERGPERGREPEPSLQRELDARRPSFTPFIRTRPLDGTPPPLDALRAQWPLLLALPPVLVAGAVLATSERVWTEAFIRVSSRYGPKLVLLGPHARLTIIFGLLAYAILPPLLPWALRARHAAPDAAADAPAPAWCRVIEWVVRVGLLAHLLSIAATLVREA